MQSRPEVIGELKSQPLDVLVIGGGIIGAGVARDAAMRGLRVGLAEQHDFAFGTSSRSTRLLHGGLRYLAQGRIGLVRQASIEKRIVHSIAPHISAPLAFVFPTYRGLPWAPWALWKLRIGVKLYDLLCGSSNFSRGTSGSRALKAAEVRTQLPGIRAAGLTGGVRYFDGLTNDARLVMDTLRSAASAGAMLLNYCRLEAAEPAGGRWDCLVTDVETGQHHEITACCVVNATGPWAGQLKHSSVRLRLTKGVHLVIDSERLVSRSEPPGLSRWLTTSGIKPDARQFMPEAVVMTEGERILFAIPWGDRVILGTTDTDYAGRPEDVRTDVQDIRYILHVVNHAFPRAELTEADVISTWAGLRPLIADPDGRPSDISRAHEIRSPEPGWWDVSGGKLTTYRLMAEQTVDRLARQLGRTLPPCTTAATPLLPAGATEFSGICPPEMTRQAVEHYCRGEWAVHLDDVMLRRAGWQYYTRDAESIARQVAGWMAETLGWEQEKREEELERYRRLTHRDAPGLPPPSPEPQSAAMRG